MLTKNVDANHGSSATTYANYLVGQIQVRRRLSSLHLSLRADICAFPKVWLLQITHQLLAVLHLYH